MELDFIHWLQSFNTPALDQFFIIVTLLGEEYFYIFVLGFCYWCVQKDVVRDLVMVLTFSSVLNSALKEVISSPRPFMVEEVRALRTETAHGRSFPSGHTQTVAAFYGAIAAKYKRVWLWIIAIVITSLVGLSRVYLGVHCPKDVIGGIIVAGISIVIIFKLTHIEQKKGISWPFFILVGAVLASFVFLHSETYIKSAGAFLGFMIGSLVESQAIKFDVRASFGKQIVKFLIGIGGTLMIFEGLKILLPDVVFFTGLRYFVSIFFVAAVVPWIFVKLKLSKHHIFS